MSNRDVGVAAAHPMGRVVQCATEELLSTKSLHFLVNSDRQIRHVKGFCVFDWQPDEAVGYHQMSSEQLQCSNWEVLND